MIVDGHEDIAYNLVIYQRDYTRSALVTRQMEREAGLTDRRPCTLGLPEWLAGEIGVIVATLFVEPARPNSWPGGLLYHTPQQAHQQAMQQLDAYHRLADENPHFRVIKTARDLDEVLARWGKVEVKVKVEVEVEVENKVEGKGEVEEEERQIGLVVAMEGADPIVEPDQVELWYERGLRMVGLAWLGTRYAGGTHEPGPLTDDGKRLLRVMSQFNLGLDLSHCAEQAFFQALDLYEGPVVASHSNPRKLVNTDRHLSDVMIRRLIERDGVIGIMPINSALKAGWQRGDRKDEVSLERVVAAIDHVCQLAGNVRHVAIGSDFDGGFGVNDIPAELDTIADLGKIGAALFERGYARAGVQAILSGNWLRILRQILQSG